MGGTNLACKISAMRSIPGSHRIWGFKHGVWESLGQLMLIQGPWPVMWRTGHPIGHGTFGIWLVDTPQGVAECYFDVLCTRLLG